MTEEEAITFQRLEVENAQLRGALTDCNRGLNAMATKLVVVGNLCGFSPDLPVEQIRAQVKLKLGTPSTTTHGLILRSWVLVRPKP